MMAGSASRKAATFYTKRAASILSEPCESISVGNLRAIGSDAMHAAAYWGYAKCTWRAATLRRLADEVYSRARAAKETP